MITASNENGTITRNSSCFKKAPARNDSEETSDDEDIDDPVCQAEAPEFEAPELPRYPRRARRHLSDTVHSYNGKTKHYQKQLTS